MSPQHVCETDVQVWKLMSLNDKNDTYTIAFLYGQYSLAVVTSESILIDWWKNERTFTVIQHILYIYVYSVYIINYIFDICNLGKSSWLF